MVVTSAPACPQQVTTDAYAARIRAAVDIWPTLGPSELDQLAAILGLVRAESAAA